MKKFVSLALAVAMTLSLSTPALATNVTATEDYTTEVTGSYIGGNEESGVVYCIDITWEDMDMTYHAEEGAVWNTETLEYSKSTPAYWEGEGTITVTNRSNTRISAVPTYTALSKYPDADMEFSTEKLKVSSAELGDEGKGSITVTPTGSLPNMESPATIGSITLTIAQDLDASVEEMRALEKKVSNSGASNSVWSIINAAYYGGTHDEYEYDSYDGLKADVEKAIVELLGYADSDEDFQDYQSTFQCYLDAIDAELENWSETGIDDYYDQSDLNQTYEFLLKAYLKLMPIYKKLNIREIG